MNWINMISAPNTIMYLVAIYFFIVISWWLYQHITQIEAAHAQQESIDKALHPEAYQEPDNWETRLAESYNWGVQEREPEWGLFKMTKLVGNFLAMSIWIAFFTCKNILLEMIGGSR